MKKLGLGLLGLLVLVVAGLLVAPSLIDWNAHKGRIAEEVRKLTGRELTIAGDLSLGLLPTPAFSAANVRFANIEGASDPAMVELEALRVRVAFLPLLQGSLQVDNVVLVKPVIRIEVLPDGRKNWEFAALGGDAAAAPGEAADDGGMPGQVRLESLMISEGTLVYRDSGKGIEERIDSLNAEVAAGSLQGPFAAEGDAVARGVPVEFEVNLGRLVTGGATPLNLGLHLPGPKAKLQFAGALSQHPETTSVRGRLKGEGGDLAALLGALSPAGDLPAALAKPFSVETEVAADATQGSFSEIVLRLDETTVGGQVQLKAGPPLDARVRLSASRIDLDKLLAAAAPEGAAPRAPGVQDARPAVQAPRPGPAAAPDTPGFALPGDVTGSLELGVDALVYRGQVVRQVLVGLDLAEGRLKLGQALALLPGGSDLNLTGTLGPVARAGQQELAFDGRLEAASDNLRGVLDWLGVDVMAVPAERLRKMSLTGRVAATRRQVTLSELDLRLDLSRATGGIAVALRERPGIGLGLAIDKLDLDAYLPRAGAAPAQERPAPGPGPAAGQGNAQGAAGPPPGAATLGAFDANLDLRVGQLTYAGLGARAVRVDGTLQQGTVTLRELGIADLAGSSARITGTIAGLTGAPTFEAGFELTVPDPVRLAKAADLDPEALVRLGALDLAGTAKGSPEEVSFESTLNALGGRFGAKGTVRPKATPAAFDVAVSAAHPDLAKLTGALAPDVRLDPAIGALDLSARVAGTPRALRVSDLAGRLGGIDVSGSLGADLAGERPALSLDLSTGILPLAALAAPAGEAKGAPAARPTLPGAAGRAGARPDLSDRWSREPLDLSALGKVDAEVKLRSKALLLGDLRLDDAVVEASLADAQVDLRKLTGTLYDGALSVTGKIDARTEPEVGLAVTAIELNLGKLLRKAAETDRVSGPLNVNASLSSRGASEAALVSALAGKGDLSGTLEVKAKAEEQVGAIVLGILGQKIKEIRGVTDATNVLFGAFAGTPAALRGTFTVEAGVVKTTDLRADGRQATALTQGTADLPAWRLDTRTDVFRAEDRQTPYLTAELRGPLNKPDVKVGGQPFQRQPEPAPAQPGAGPAPTAPTAPQQIKPEDALKQELEKGLKGLLKGLGN